MLQRAVVFGLLAIGWSSVAAAAPDDEAAIGPLDVTPKPIAGDTSVRYDYEIVYVRAGRAGDTTHKRFFTDIAAPVTLERGADLVLLRPDGSEERLVAGWMCDDNRPVVTIAWPRADHRGKLSRIVIGMHDYYSGLDLDSVHIKANHAIGGVAAGANLYELLDFVPKSEGVWELTLDKPIDVSDGASLSVSVKGRQGNLARTERTLRTPGGE